MRRPLVVVVLMVVLTVPGPAGCGTNGGGGGQRAAVQSTSSTSARAPTGAGGTGGPGPSATIPFGSSSAPESAPTTRDRFAGAGDGPRTAPSPGRGAALLTNVRLGRNDGYERIVFEFRGAHVPGYRIRYVKGPITADGSGEPVAVKGAARLEVIMQPASGVNVEGDGKPTYTGPDRLPPADGVRLIRDLVRTGDFEAVLTWVAGLRERVPFKVSTLSSPARLLVDVKTG